MSLADVLDDHDQVLDTATVLEYLTCDQLRWKLRSGRWQRPARGIVVAQSGPLTAGQVSRVAGLWGGPRSVIGGLSAAWLGGFTGFGDRKPAAERPVFLLVPPGWNTRHRVAGIRIVPRYSRTLLAADVHPVQEPRRTRIGRSLIDAAQWMGTDRGAMAVLAAGVQQRLVRVGDLAAVVARYQRLRRRQLIVGALDDIAAAAPRRCPNSTSPERWCGDIACQNRTGRWLRRDQRGRLEAMDRCRQGRVDDTGRDRRRAAPERAGVLGRHGSRQ